MALLRGPEFQAAAIRLARRGHRPAEIAVRLGRPAGTVSAALSDARADGIDVPRCPPGPAPGSCDGRRMTADARRREMATMAASGLRSEEIGVRMECSASAVSSVLSRARRAGMVVPVVRRGRPRIAVREGCPVSR